MNFVALQMSQRRQKSLTVEEILAALEEAEDDDNVERADVIINPPEADALTDNEDIDDDCTEDIDTNEVAGTLELHTTVLNTDDDVNDNEAGKATEATTEKGNITKKRKLSQSIPKWRSKAPNYTKVHTRSNVYESNLMKMKEQLTDFSPVSVFEEVFSEEMVQLTLKETLRYATECKNRPSTTFSSDDLKLFIGVLLISGYHKLPSETHYWSNDEDLGLQVVKNAISKAKFQDMKSIIHFCDNSEVENNKNDRGFKVRKLIAAAQKSFAKFGILEEHLAIDEMIVKYYGHHALKQFIRGKPIRFGYKFWALCGV